MNLNRYWDSSIFTGESSIPNVVRHNISSPEAAQRTFQQEQEILAVMLKPGEYCGSLAQDLKDFVNMK